MYLATVTLVSPASDLAPMALEELNSALALFQVVRGTIPKHVLGNNVRWLERVRDRAESRLRSVHRTEDGVPHLAVTDNEAESNLTLVGWRTRLVQAEVSNPSRSVPNHSVEASYEHQPMTWPEDSLPDAQWPDLVRHCPVLQLMRSVAPDFGYTTVTSSKHQRRSGQYVRDVRS